MLCYVILCYVTLYYIILYHIISYYIISYYIISYYIILYHVILYYITLYIRLRSFTYISIYIYIYIVQYVYICHSITRTCLQASCVPLFGQLRLKSHQKMLRGDGVANPCGLVKVRSKYEYEYFTVSVTVRVINKAFDTTVLGWAK